MRARNEPEPASSFAATMALTIPSATAHENRAGRSQPAWPWTGEQSTPTKRTNRPDDRLFWSWADPVAD